MNWKIISLLLFPILIINCANNKKKDEKDSSKTTQENPFKSLLINKLKSYAAPFAPNLSTDEDQIKKTLWAGNGVIRTIKTDNNKKIKVYTHPIDFATLLKLFFINQDGVYQYNNQDNSLQQIKKGDYRSILKIPDQIKYNSHTHLVMVLNLDKNLMINELKNYKGVYPDSFLEKLKNIIIWNYSKNRIRESAFTEAGMALQNMMLLLTAYNYSYFPTLFHNQSNQLTTLLRLKQNEIPAIALSIGNKNNRSSNSSHINYVTSLIKNAKNSTYTEFNIETRLDMNIIRLILWAGNGLIKENKNNKNSKTLSCHTGLVDSLINLYYINNERVHLYDPETDTLITIKYGDYRHRLGERAKVYKSKDVILLTVKKSFNLKKINIVPSSESISQFKKALTTENGLQDVKMLQIGAAAENIRLVAADHQLAFQLIGIQSHLRDRMGKALSLKDGDTPVYMIPVGYKQSGTQDNKSKPTSR